MNVSKAYFAGRALAEILQITSNARHTTESCRGDAPQDPSALAAIASELRAPLERIGTAFLDPGDPFPPEPANPQWTAAVIEVRKFQILCLGQGSSERNAAEALDYCVNARMATKYQYLRKEYGQRLGQLVDPLWNLLVKNRELRNLQTMSLGVVGLYEIYGCATTVGARSIRRGSYLAGGVVSGLRRLLAFAFPDRYAIPAPAGELPGRYRGAVTRLQKAVCSILSHVQGHEPADVAVLIRLGFCLRRLLEPAADEAEPATVPQLLPKISDVAGDSSSSAERTYFLSCKYWLQLAMQKAGFPKLQQLEGLQTGAEHGKGAEQTQPEAFAAWAATRHRDVRAYLHRQFGKALTVELSSSRDALVLSVSYCGDEATGTIQADWAERQRACVCFLRLLRQLQRDLRPSGATRLEGAGWLEYQVLDPDSGSKASGPLRTWRFRMNKLLDQVWRSIIDEPELDGTFERPLTVSRASKTRGAYRLKGLALDERWKITVRVPRSWLD